jgi:hypothetical protein
MITYQNLVDDSPPLHTQRSGKATHFDDLRSGRSGLPEQASQYGPMPARLPSDPSANGQKNAQSAAEVVAVRFLAVLTVVLFAISMIGLTIISQDGNSTTAIVSGAVGISSAPLGFIVAFHNAYRATS